MDKRARSPSPPEPADDIDTLRKEATRADGVLKWVTIVDGLPAGAQDADRNTLFHYVIKWKDTDLTPADNTVLNERKELLRAELAREDHEKAVSGRRAPNETLKSQYMAPNFASTIRSRFRWGVIGAPRSTTEEKSQSSITLRCYRKRGNDTVAGEARAGATVVTPPTAAGAGTAASAAAAAGASGTSAAARQAAAAPDSDGGGDARASTVTGPVDDTDSTDEFESFDFSASDSESQPYPWLGDDAATAKWTEGEKKRIIQDVTELKSWWDTRKDDDVLSGLLGSDLPYNVPQLDPHEDLPPGTVVALSAPTGTDGAAAPGGRLCASTHFDDSVILSRVVPTRPKKLIAGDEPAPDDTWKRVLVAWTGLATVVVRGCAAPPRCGSVLLASPKGDGTAVVAPGPSDKRVDSADFQRRVLGFVWDLNPQHPGAVKLRQRCARQHEFVVEICVDVPKVWHDDELAVLERVERCRAAAHKAETHANRAAASEGNAASHAAKARRVLDEQKRRLGHGGARSFLVQAALVLAWCTLSIGLYTRPGTTTPPTNCGHFTRQPHWTTTMDDRASSVGEKLREHGRVAIVGGGGTGKSSTAVAYVLRYSTAYSRGTFWINAETPDTARASYAEIARLLRLDIGERDAADEVQSWLTDDKEPGRWLLVFDNVEDLDTLSRENLRPGDAALKRGDVIITARLEPTNASTWPKAQTIETRLLEVEDAATVFLRAALGRRDVLFNEWSGTVASTERDAVLEIVGPSTLNRLPIALTHVGWLYADSVVGDSTLSFAKLRDSLQKEIATAQHETFLGGQVDTHVIQFATWKMQLERLSSDARDVMRALSVMAPDDVPKSMLERMFSAAERPQAVDAAVPALFGLRLVTSDEANRSLWSVHRLVQAAVRRWMTHADKVGTLRNVTANLTPMLPEWSQYSEQFAAAREQGAMYAHHAAAALGHAAVIQRLPHALIDRSALLAFQRLACRLAEYYVGTERAMPAVHLSEQCVDGLRQQRDSKGNATLDALVSPISDLEFAAALSARVEALYVSRLASSNAAALSEVLQIAPIVEDIRRRELRDNHTDLARAINNNGVLAYRGGNNDADIEAAQHKLQEAVAMRLRVSEEPNRDTVTYMTNLATILQKRGLHEDWTAVTKRAHDMAVRLPHSMPAVAWAHRAMAVNLALAPGDAASQATQSAAAHRHMDQAVSLSAAIFGDGVDQAEFLLQAAELRLHDNDTVRGIEAAQKALDMVSSQQPDPAVISATMRAHFVLTIAATKARDARSHLESMRGLFEDTASESLHFKYFDNLTTKAREKVEEAWGSSATGAELDVSRPPLARVR